MKTKTDPIVNITDFESLPLFLKEFYQAKKQREASFSFEKWNRALGAKNRSYLQLLVSGKRKVNDEYREMFLDYFLFNRLQRQHFLELTQMELSRSSESRAQLKKSLSHRKRIAKTRVIEAQEAYLSNLKIPALFALTTFTDFEANVTNLAARIGESEATTEAWLKIIEDMNLVSLDESTKTWKAVDNVLIIPVDKQGILKKYQRMSLETAIECLDAGTLKADPTSYQVWLHEDQVAEFNRRAQTFADQIVMEDMRDEVGDRKLYQWTWAIFPILK